MIARRDNVRRISNEQSPELAQIALSRRKFLGTALTGTAATLAGATLMSSLSTEPALAQSPLIPDEALKVLLDGNARFASGRLSSFDKDLKVLRDRTVDKQEPYAAVLSCADSRVPVEIIFDETIGHIFIARTRS
jgi:carbonic anhydrase